MFMWLFLRGYSLLGVSWYYNFWSILAGHYNTTTNSWCTGIIYMALFWAGYSTTTTTEFGFLSLILGRQCPTSLDYPAVILPFHRAVSSSCSWPCWPPPLIMLYLSHPVLCPAH